MPKRDKIFYPNGAMEHIRFKRKGCVCVQIRLSRCPTIPFLRLCPIVPPNLKFCSWQRQKFQTGWDTGTIKPEHLVSLQIPNSTSNLPFQQSAYPAVSFHSPVSLWFQKRTFSRKVCGELSHGWWYSWDKTPPHPQTYFVLKIGSLTAALYMTEGRLSFKETMLPPSMSSLAGTQNQTSQAKLRNCSTSSYYNLFHR